MRPNWPTHYGKVGLKGLSCHCSSPTHRTGLVGSSHHTSAHLWALYSRGYAVRYPSSEVPHSVLQADLSTSLAQTPLMTTVHRYCNASNTVLRILTSFADNLPPFPSEIENLESTSASSPPIIATSPAFSVVSEGDENHIPSINESMVCNTAH